MRKIELIYPEWCYKLVGILFDVHSKVGGGHREIFIQKAIEESLKANKISYKRELICPLVYRGKSIGKNVLDFLIDDKIVLEIKKGERFNKSDIEQVFEYLKTSNLKLGILATFTRQKVRFRRIVNL